MQVSSKTVFMLVLTSLSTTTLLSSCSYASRTWDDWTNDREEQVVAGPRRVPALNPQPAMKAPEAPSQPRPRAAAMGDPFVQQTEAAPKKVPTFDEDPYAYFDEDGNRLSQDELEASFDEENPKAASSTMETPDIMKDNVFTRMFDRITGPSEVEQLRAQPRKPLMDNDYAPEVEVPFEPQPALQPMTQQQPAAPVMREAEDNGWAFDQATNQPDYIAEPAETFTEAPEADITAPLAELDRMEETEVVTLPAAEVSAPREEKSWFARMADDVEKAFTSEEEQQRAMQEDRAQLEEMPYPLLSDVPPAPQAFVTVKEEKEAQMQALQDELLLAQEQREALYNEPSSQSAMVPLDMDPVDTKENAPEAEMFLPQEAPQSLRPAAGEPATFAVMPKGSEASESGEVLLGEISDNTAPADIKSDAAALTAQGEMPAMQMAESGQPTAASEADEALAEEGAWWDEWNLFSSRSYTDEAIEQDAPAASPEQEVISEMQSESVEPVAQTEPATMQRADMDNMPWWEQDALRQQQETGAVNAPTVEAERVETPQENEIADSQGLPQPVAVRGYAPESQAPEMPVFAEQPQPMGVEQLQPEDAGMEEVLLRASDSESTLQENIAPQMPAFESSPQPVTLVEQAQPEVESSENAQLEEELRPLMEKSPAAGSAESILVPQPMQVREEAAAPAMAAQAPAEDALPSTQLLREVRTLPASRYSGRRAQ